MIQEYTLDYISERTELTGQSLHDCFAELDINPCRRVNNDVYYSGDAVIQLADSMKDWLKSERLKQAIAINQGQEYTREKILPEEPEENEIFKQSTDMYINIIATKHATDERIEKCWQEIDKCDYVLYAKLFRFAEAIKRHA